MTSTYTSVFNSFLGLIEDYDFTLMSNDDVNEVMVEYLHKAVSKPYTRRLFESITLDDSIFTITYTMINSVDDEQDKDFTEDVLAHGMAIEWLTPQVRSKLNIRQMFTNNKESKFYAQSTHLNELKDLLDSVKDEQRRLIADRGYVYNTYLNQ